MKEEDLGCWTRGGGRADTSIIRVWKPDIWLVIIVVSKDQGLESRSGFLPLLAMVRGVRSPSHLVPKQQPLLWGTEALLSRDTELCAWLSCSACFQHPALISSQTCFYPWDTSRNFPFIQKEAAIFQHYHSTDNTYYKQQSCEGMPEPCGWLVHDLRRRCHTTACWPEQGGPSCPGYAALQEGQGIATMCAPSLRVPKGSSHRKRCSL